MNIEATKYTKGAIYMHWALAIMMMVMLFLGEDMIQHPTATFYPSLHASLGISILVLTVVRLWWRLTHKPPVLPAAMKGWEVKVSHVTHFLFYALMIGLPLSGMLAFGHEAPRDAIVAGATWFGVIPIPQLPDFGQLGPNMHGLGSKVGQILLILHVLAALKHQFWDKDNLLRRMSPH